ncbi:MAG: FAD-binding oxidoreductase [Candidatus Omnitrophota bacterium]|nr:FAD-binding oxidoreductase [Candidatus Omnitrophota bacterium]
MQRVRTGFRLLGSLVGSLLTAFGTAVVPTIKQIGLRPPFAALVALSASACQAVRTAARAVVLNDVHSRLNPTSVASLVYPRSTSDLVEVIQAAKRGGQHVSISAGRHAMGGQQFGTGTVHINMARMDDVLAFDRERGVVRVEAGIGWPKLMQSLNETQQGEPGPTWAIAQKQTGADELSLGGALSANAHGRGLRFRPMIQDVEAFTLVNADGEVLTVSRTQHPELFRLAIGGYGLFGAIATVDLRLTPRQKLRRVVEVVSINDLPEKVRERFDVGAHYGDYQYKTDVAAPDFMQVGVLSTYHPVPLDTPIPADQKRLSLDDWNELLVLAHARKSEAFERYSRHYLSTNGQIYWSDLHQMSYYNDAYEDYLRRTMPDYTEGSLMITEVYIPRAQIQQFSKHVIEDARAYAFDVIYGTMRLIERDEESFLCWAKQNYACIIFNLRVQHTPEGIAKAKRDFQRIIDCALGLGGSYYLTYHRWARKDQVLMAYPQFPEFLRWKLCFDPEERFQSDWYRHYKAMFAEELAQQPATLLPAHPL